MIRTPRSAALVALLVTVSFVAPAVAAPAPPTPAADVDADAGPLPSVAVGGASSTADVSTAAAASNVTVAPAGLNESDRRRVTVTATLSNLSADGERDVVHVAFDRPIVDADYANASATANGSAVPVVQGGVAFPVRQRPAPRTVVVGVNATGPAATTDVTLTVEATVQANAVENDTVAPVSVSVREGATSDATATGGLTVRNTTALGLGDQLFCPGGSGPIVGVPSTCPNDTDGDGLLEDLDGDGDFDFVDVVEFVFSVDTLTDPGAVSDAQAEVFDHDESGEVDFGDVIDLVFDVQSG